MTREIKSDLRDKEFKKMTPLSFMKSWDHPLLCMSESDPKIAYHHTLRTTVRQTITRAHTDHWGRICSRSEQHLRLLERELMLKIQSTRGQSDFMTLIKPGQSLLTQKYQHFPLDLNNIISNVQIQSKITWHIKKKLKRKSQLTWGKKTMNRQQY